MENNMKNKEMTGRRVFGYGGLSGFAPYIYTDKGAYGTADVKLRAVSVAMTLENLNYETANEIIGERPEPYGYRTQGGVTALYDLPESALDALIAANAKIEEAKLAKIKAEQAEYEKQAEAENERLKAIRDSVKDFVCKSYTATDEGGKTTDYHITVTCHNGKVFEFTDRNIFDFGRVVNPEYKITENSDGAIAYKAALILGGHAGSRIRM